MNKPIIEVKNLGKSYKIGEKESYLALRDKMAHPIKAFKGLKKKDIFWALRNVNFDIKRGGAIGIIGRNGAGKSTLLKILSRITPPTEGEIVLRGRVGSLLEVGTGFHPELTGRENIFLNGAILGMRKQEIKDKMDQIIEFSGVEKFIDTPVKRYSSGMYVRLAFSVAAHLEPDILIVDEVLAVGDIDFQKKCLGKMEEVTKKEGRTVILVSHNMSMIQRLCSSCILLENGKVAKNGKVDEVVNYYLSGMVNPLSAPSNVFQEDLKKNVQLLSIKMLDADGEVKKDFSCDESVNIEMVCKIRKQKLGLYGLLAIRKPDGTTVLQSDSFDKLPNNLENLKVGVNTIKVSVPARSLGPGEYVVFVQFVHDASNDYEIDVPGLVCSFTLDDSSTRRGPYRLGFLSTLLDWNIN